MTQESNRVGGVVCINGIIIAEGVKFLRWVEWVHDCWDARHCNDEAIYLLVCREEELELSYERERVYVQ